MTDFDHESFTAKGRAQAKALEAALLTLAAEGGDAVFFSNSGRLGIKIDPRYNVMELTSYMEVQRAGTHHLLCDKEVIQAVLVAGAAAYALVYAQTQIGFNQEPAPEPVPESGEGAGVLPVQEPEHPRLVLVGAGSGQGMPSGTDSQFAADAFDRR